MGRDDTGTNTATATDALVTRERVRSFDGTELEVQTTARNGPDILLVNGLGGSIAAWRHLYRHFVPAFRIVSFDYRGLYGSGAPADPAAVRVEDHLADLERVVQATEARRAVVLAWSMGVQVAVEYAVARPAAVAGLVLVCGAPGDPFAGVFRTTVSRWAVPAACRVIEAFPRCFGAATRPLLTAKAAPALLQRARIVSGATDLDVFSDMSDRFSRLDWRTYFRTMRAMADHDAWPRLNEITAPTLCIGGTRDLFTPPEVAKQTAEAVQHGEAEVIDGASHYAPVEYPDLVNERIERFLVERVDGRWGRSALALEGPQPSNEKPGRGQHPRGERRTRGGRHVVEAL